MSLTGEYLHGQIDYGTLNAQAEYDDRECEEEEDEEEDEEEEESEDYIIREDAFMALTGDITDCTIEEFIARLKNKLSKLPSVKADGDCISRAGLKLRLQEHHDFFVNAYGGFSNLPPNDKARVDEITNCIAEVMNMPSVQTIRPKGHWIIRKEQFDDELEVREVYGCNYCGFSLKSVHDKSNYCPNCGADMREV